MTLGANSAILPAWVVLPPTAIMLLILGIHVLSVQGASVPVRRRRIRTASGLLMMFVTALLAYALCIDPFASHPVTSPHEAQNTLLLWLTIVGLVGVIVVLAALDVVHTLSLGYFAKRRLDESISNRATTEVSLQRREGARDRANPGPEPRPATDKDRRRG